MKVIIAVVVQMLFFLSVASAQSRVVLTTKWGEYGSKPGEFKFPAMITVDKQSNLYVVDQHNHRIQKFDSAGNFILMWGKAGGGEGEFNYPYGIAIDSGGNVYVSDMNNNRIQKFTANGEFIAASGKYGSADGEFRYPYGLAIDKNNVLYVIDAFNYRIQKFTADLIFTGKWGSPEIFGIKLYMPHELAVSAAGNIIVSDRQNHRLAIFTNDGKLVTRVGEYGEGKQVVAGKYSEPHGIAVNEKGEMFVSDRYNFSIHLLDAKYKPVLSWQTTGILDDSNYFPLGVTVSKNEDIYVSDNYAHCILKYRFYGE